MVRYYEVIFDNGTGDIESMDSLCIRAIYEPTVELLEADWSFQEDRKLFGNLPIHSIEEIDEDTAKYFFDMDDYNYIFTKNGFVKRGDNDEEHFGYC